VRQAEVILVYEQSRRFERHQLNRSILIQLARFKNGADWRA
jgi:hypothetical protein